MPVKNEFVGFADEQLVHLLHAGNDDAFDCLYVRYRNKLVTVVCNRVRSVEIAEEIVQEMFVDIWRKRRELTIRTTFSGYIFTAAEYAVLDYIRSQKVKDRYVSEILAVNKNMVPSVGQPSDFEELDYHLNKNIEELPEKCREVFRLSRFENYSVKQIALELDISPNTVKYHITAALRILRLNLRHLYILVLYFFL